MRITFAPKDILQIDEARIVYRNFSGAPSKFNREGDRNFALIIPNNMLIIVNRGNDPVTGEPIDEEILLEDYLTELGWNVKIKPPRDEDDDPFIFLPVKVKFNGRGPVIWLVSGRNRTKLDEDTVGLLDDCDILDVSLDIRPYDYDFSGHHGRAAYLQSMSVTQNIDRFTAKFAAEESPEE